MSRQMKDISLDLLHVDKENVRRSPAADEEHAELVASIRAHDLLENLVVTPREDGTYGVAAGGRRYAALKTIHEEDGGDAPLIPCMVVTNGDAEELSLAENTIRVAMHPADQMRAFGNLARAGKTPEQIGVRFGYPQNEVKALLRLGSLPDKIIDDWRDGALGEQEVYTFATTEDMEFVSKVYDQLKKGNQLTAYRIREVLDENRTSADGAIAKYVTLAAYRKAGGGIEETLFARDGDKLTDPKLLTDLALKKLDRSAKRLAKEGWKWVESALSFGWQDEQRYETWGIIPDDPTEDEAKRLKEIDAELAEIDRKCEAGELEWNERWPLRNPLQEEARKIKIAAQKRGGYTDEQKAICGAIVHIDRDGRGRIRRGMVAAADRAAYKRATRRESADEDGYVPPGAKPKGPYPKAVMDDVRLMRGAAVVRAMADNPRVARDVLAFALARLSRFCTEEGRRYEDKLLNIDLPHLGNRGGVKLQEDECGDAVLAPFAGRAKWDWLNADQDELDNAEAGFDAYAAAFERFMAQTPQARDRVLAHVVAELLVPRLLDESPAFERMVSALKVHFPDRTKEAGVRPWPIKSFWNRLSKAAILDAGKKEFGEEWATNHARLKKGELVVAAHEAFAESTGWSPEGVEEGPDFSEAEA